MGLITSAFSSAVAETEDGSKIYSPNIIVTSLDKLVNWEFVAKNLRSAK